MSVYNSSTNHDDDDTTMMNQSFVFGDSNDRSNDSVTRRLQQVHRRQIINPTSDYIYVEHDRLEYARQIEQILKHYRQDLKQQTNTQYACNNNLIARLVDVIRPIYASNENQMKDLHDLFEEISDLQDVRFIEHKEKLEHLTNEVAHLKKLILGTNQQEENTMAKAFQINSMVNYEQWQQLEDETKQLQNLVETQRTKINELVQLLSNDDNPPIVTPDRPTTTTTTDVRKSESTVDMQRAITVRNLRTFTRLPTSNQTQIISCPICNHKFPLQSTDIDIDKHIDKCLISLDKNTSTSEQYQCPRCQKYFPVNDKVYLQHLTDCLNRIAKQVKRSKIRICPLCQAIFNITSMNDQQYQQHVDAHI